MQLESWPYGELICKVSECAKDISIGVSVFTLTALSAERYCAIVNPMRRHVSGRLSTKPVTLLTALGIWVLAILLALPAAIFSYVPDLPLEEANKTIKVLRNMIFPNTLKCWLCSFEDVPHYVLAVSNPDLEVWSSGTV